jgi:hypothetical protein
MPTVRQRRILEDLGITCWVDRSRAAASVASGVAAARAALPDDLRALLEAPTARPAARRSGSDREPESGASTVPRPAAGGAAQPVRLPAALGCLWVPGTLLLCEAELTPEDRRFCRDLLLAGAALDTIDRASTSHRARMAASSKPQWLAVAATDLTSGSGDFGSAVLGLLRKRIESAAARRLLICGGPQGLAARWLAASEQDTALSDQLDPALAALGARLGCWQRDSQPLPVLVLPPIALLRSEPARKARLWHWLLEAGRE